MKKILLTVLFALIAATNANANEVLAMNTIEIEVASINHNHTSSRATLPSEVVAMFQNMDKVVASVTKETNPTINSNDTIVDMEKIEIAIAEVRTMYGFDEKF